MSEESRGESVRVVVRVRPANESESKDPSGFCVRPDAPSRTLFLDDSRNAENQKAFEFDSVFGPGESQRVIYEQSAFSVVESFVEGVNGTVFAYGQTGCGKTFTMLGVPGNEEMKGVIPRACEHVLTRLGTSKVTFSLSCSFIEVYNEGVYDLLTPGRPKLELKAAVGGGAAAQGAAQKSVTGVKELLTFLNQGSANRSVGATAMNRDSSRSHCVFTLHLEAVGPSGPRWAKLNLVDLAGSERQARTQAAGDRLREATSINVSLSALGNVIAALSTRSAHVPYRDSKLTRLLQDSLGGNTRTLMLAAVSPSAMSYEETLSTLNYAARAKKIKNVPRVNEDPKDALLKTYQAELAALKAALGSAEPPQPQDQSLPAEEDVILRAEVAKREGLEEQLAALQARLEGLRVKQNEEAQKTAEVAEEVGDKIEIGETRDQAESSGANPAEKIAPRLSVVPTISPEEVKHLEYLERVKAEEAAREAQRRSEEARKPKIQRQTNAAELRAQLRRLDFELLEATERAYDEGRELIDGVHSNEAELGFLRRVCEALYSQDEIGRLLEKTRFDPLNESDPMVPKFALRPLEDPERQLPTLKRPHVLFNPPPLQSSNLPLLKDIANVLEPIVPKSRQRASQLASLPRRFY